MMDYTPPLISRLQDALRVPTAWCRPLISVQWGFGSRRWPNPLNIAVRVLHDVYSPPWAPMPALYLNGLLFVSVRLPFFIGVMVRWGNDDVSPAFLQAHVGWRPADGRPVVVFRVQSDASAQGGLAIGFEDGPK